MPKKDDPLYKSNYIIGRDFRLHASAQLYICPGMEGLRKVIPVEYKELVGLSYRRKTGFARNVPESVFAYYCATLAYARLLHLVNETMLSCSKPSSPLTNDELQFLRAVEPYFVSKSILSTYLEGFGSIRTVNGHILKFKFLNPTYMQSSGINGWFGRISEDTHLFYKTYPCLAVFVQAMIQDLKYTEGIDGVTWNLPENIRPSQPRAGLPTENLLGYQRAIKLTAESVNFLATAGVMLSQPLPFDNSTLPLLLDLFSCVHSQISILHNDIYRVEKPSSTGSLAQCVTIIHGPQCYYKIDEEKGYWGSVFQYRIYHQWEPNPQNEETVKANWSIYDFNHRTEVPKTWTETINKQRSEEPFLLNGNFFKADSDLFLLRNMSSPPFHWAKFWPCFTKNIFPGCDGFRSVVLIEYRRLWFTNAFFRNEVSFSAFAYYCAVIVYLKFSCFNNFVYISSTFRGSLGNYGHLELLNTYLQGFGDTSINHESKINCSFPKLNCIEGEDGLSGWFGKVSKDTHFLYKSYPCLPVFLQAIIHDLKFTNGMDVEHWDLPQEFRPDEENAGLPTKNMLGYQPAVRLTAKQVQFLNASGIINGIKKDDLSSTKPPILISLFHSIANIITFTSNSQRELLENKKGSQGQLLIIKPDVNTDKLESLSKWNVQCPIELDDRVTSLGSLFQYRVYHQYEKNLEKIGSVKANWSVYDFNKFTEVPVSWAETANTMRNREPNFLNGSESDGLFEVVVKNPENEFTNLHLKNSTWP